MFIISLSFQVMDCPALGSRRLVLLRRFLLALGLETVNHSLAIWGTVEPPICLIAPGRRRKPDCKHTIGHNCLERQRYKVRVYALSQWSTFLLHTCPGRIRSPDPRHCGSPNQFAPPSPSDRCTRGASGSSTVRIWRTVCNRRSRPRSLWSGIL